MKKKNYNKGFILEDSRKVKIVKINSYDKDQAYGKIASGLGKGFICFIQLIALPILI